MATYQKDNVNTAIASGLAEELAKELGHRVQAYGPASETDFVHAMVIGPISGVRVDQKREAMTLYSIKVCDGKAVLRVIGGDMALLADAGEAREFEIMTPSFIADVVAGVKDLWDRSKDEANHVVVPFVALP
jgi:hypothetical protein